MRRMLWENVWNSVYNDSIIVFLPCSLTFLHSKRPIRISLHYVIDELFPKISKKKIENVVKSWNNIFQIVKMPTKKSQTFRIQRFSAPWVDSLRLVCLLRFRKKSNECDNGQNVWQIHTYDMGFDSSTYVLY